MTVAIRAAALCTLRVPRYIATYIRISLRHSCLCGCPQLKADIVTVSLNGLQANILKNNATLKSDRRHIPGYSIILTCRQRKHTYMSICGIMASWEIVATNKPIASCT